MINLDQKIYGYRRDNNRVGIRNYVVILPVDDISNAACEAVSNNIKGTIALPHPYGRLQFGEDLDLHFRTMIGTGANPNVAAVVVIGIEPGWTQKIVDGIAATGKPVQGFSIEKKGDIQTIEMPQKQLMTWFITLQAFKEKNVISVSYGFQLSVVSQTQLQALDQIQQLVMRLISFMKKIVPYFLVKHQRLQVVNI